MRKTVIILMILTILSKIFGFGREITLSYFFGASNISDAYLISLTIPTVIFSFVGIALQTTYIPLYSDILKNKGQTLGNQFTNKVILSLMIVSTLIVIIVLGFTTQIVKMFASGFTGETLKLAIQLTRITTLGVYFIGTNYIFEAYLQVSKNYIVPAMVGFPLNFMIVLSIIIGARSDYRILGFGQILGVISQLILLVFFMYKEGYRFNFHIDLFDKNMYNLLYLSIPVMLGTSVNQINKLVDRTIASNIIEGGISALVYANRLNLFIQGIFVLSISTVMYPQISRMAVSKDITGLKNSLIKSIRAICILILPVTVGSVLFSKPIIRLLFGRGAFGSSEVQLTANALLFYSIGMIGFGLREVLSRAFFSMKYTKTPMINAVIGMTLNIILNIILSKYLGIGGLALATSISALVTTGLLYVSLKHRIGALGIRTIMKDIIKVTLASLIMGFFATLGYMELLNWIGEVFALILSVILGALSYLVIITIMGIDDIKDIICSAIYKFFER
jgi:putative peptidoglycan lipid II flippase